MKYMYDTRLVRGWSLGPTLVAVAESFLESREVAQHPYSLSYQATYHGIIQHYLELGGSGTGAKYHS